MFFPGSRYEKAGTIIVTMADGRIVSATKIPRPQTRQLLGFHRREDIHRLDHIAAHYLKDATAFWKLCEVNEAICPDALAKHDLIGVPVKD